MKTELVCLPHAVVPGAISIELWHDGVFVGTVVWADEPGVRVLSKHQLVAMYRHRNGSDPNIVEVVVVPHEPTEV